MGKCLYFVNYDLGVMHFGEGRFDGNLKSRVLLRIDNKTLQEIGWLSHVWSGTLRNLYVTTTVSGGRVLSLEGCLSSAPLAEGLPWN